MVAIKKFFLDDYLVRNGLAPDKKQAQSWIMAGKILVDGQVVLKRGQKVGAKNQIAIKEGPKFVSRGGDKLESALRYFGIDVKDKICLDIGASTGGFTDCLRQRGARLVYALDCGKNLLHEKLRRDQQVIDISGVNFRYFPSVAKQFINYPIDLVVIDVSFISLKLILVALQSVLVQTDSQMVDILALVKPQFEAKYSEVRNGLVKDRMIIRRCLAEVARRAAELNFIVKDSVPSALSGARGNSEQFLWLKFSGFSIIQELD